jgi:hypothetical protein
MATESYLQKRRREEDLSRTICFGEDITDVLEAAKIKEEPEVRTRQMALDPEIKRYHSYETTSTIQTERVGEFVEDLYMELIAASDYFNDYFGFKPLKSISIKDEEGHLYEYQPEFSIVPGFFNGKNIEVIMGTENPDHAFEDETVRTYGDAFRYGCEVLCSISVGNPLDKDPVVASHVEVYGLKNLPIKVDFIYALLAKYKQKANGTQEPTSKELEMELDQ